MDTDKLLRDAVTESIAHAEAFRLASKKRKRSIAIDPEDVRNCCVLAQPFLAEYLEEDSRGITVGELSRTVVNILEGIKEGLRERSN